MHHATVPENPAYMHGVMVRMVVPAAPAVVRINIAYVYTC